MADGGAERVTRLIPHGSTRERYAELPFEAPKTSSLDRVLQQTEEQIFDAPVVIQIVLRDIGSTASCAATGDGRSLDCLVAFVVTMKTNERRA